MISKEQAQVGRWVLTLREWPGVLIHSAGQIVEDYGTGVTVEWWTRGWRGATIETGRVRDGFNKESEFQYLAPMESEWVPYLATPMGIRTAKIMMKNNERLSTREDAIRWIQTGQMQTHPELNGRNIACVDEPIWPDPPERILTT